jgi:sulfate adenylyltransferase subunit 1 (EFTu-like GTPase family)
MRGKWWVGLMTIAVAVPFGAHAQAEHAQIQATNVHDLWYSGNMRMTGLPNLSRSPVVAAQSSAAPAQSGPMVAVVREPSTIRGFKAASATGSNATGGAVAIAPTRAAPTTTPQATAAPEMNSGLAAAALTLLFGGVAILRSRRTGLNAP